MTVTSTSSSRIIFVLEDDVAVADTLVHTLKPYGFDVRHFARSAGLLSAIGRSPPALCIVDLGLPDRDGLDVVKEIRSLVNCGVMILTGRGYVADKVAGLEVGADDYIVKPFEPRELVARIRSILRRTHADGHEGGEPARQLALFDGWSFDGSGHALTSPAGETQTLSSAETRLLTELVRNSGRVLSREQLAGSNDLLPYDRTIDVRISRLRKKLQDDSQHPQLIRSVYGAGYLFAPAVVWQARKPERRASR